MTFNWAMVDKQYNITETEAILIKEAYFSNETCWSLRLVLIAISGGTVSRSEGKKQEENED